MCSDNDDHRDERQLAQTSAHAHDDGLHITAG